jgi:exopolysaccharide biosynthesis polyprenyl glycosylphosphotransferase
MLSRNTNKILLALILDILSIFTAATVAAWLRLRLPFGIPIPEIPELIPLIWEVLLIYPLIFLLFSLYDPERTFNPANEYQTLMIASLIADLVLAGLVYFTIREISRLYLVYFYVIQFALVTSWRSVERMVRRSQNEKGRDLRKVLLIGGGEAARYALDRLHELAWAGVYLVGYLTDGEPIPTANGDIHLLGGLQDADRILDSQTIDDVLIALPAEAYHRVQELTTTLINKPCNLWVAPDYFSLLLYGSRVEDLGGVPMISLKAPALTGYQRLIKRFFDLVVAGVSTVIGLPVMGLISLAVKLDSPGPVIFKQQRVGENGRVFYMYKFRSMVADADERLQEVMFLDPDGNLVHKRQDDPRITRVGHILRRTSLDEIPQLFNVLKGEMSLVGPRPEMPIFVANYQPWQRKRLVVPQGITGWWQINGRSDKPMHLHTEDDLFYVQNYSLLLDVQILLKTIWVVFFRKGAY